MSEKNIDTPIRNLEEWEVPVENTGDSATDSANPAGTPAAEATPAKTPAKTSGKNPNRLTTKAIVACVIFGAIGAVLAFGSRYVSLSLRTTVPWLGYPAPMPFFILAMTSSLLIRRRWAGLFTGFVSFLGGFGILSLIGGIGTEIIFNLTPKRLREKAPLSKGMIGSAIGMGVLSGALLWSTGLAVPEVRLWPTQYYIYSISAWLIAGAVYGVIAWLIAKALERAGYNPQGITQQ